MQCFHDISCLMYCTVLYCMYCTVLYCTVVYSVELASILHLIPLLVYSSLNLHWHLNKQDIYSRSCMHNACHAKFNNTSILFIRQPRIERYIKLKLRHFERPLICREVSSRQRAVARNVDVLVQLYLSQFAAVLLSPLPTCTFNDMHWPFENTHYNLCNDNCK